ncbi:MAG: hypothetical protein JXN60_07055 [Lentisphaerae bacterium]|nr:hypothetical protein [Lentisphaerota bacterium]
MTFPAPGTDTSNVPSGEVSTHINARQNTAKWMSQSLLLLLAVAMVYGNTLWNGYTFDDRYVYDNNGMIRNWQNIGRLLDKSYFPLSGEASYRPFCTLTYFADATLWRGWHGGPHLTNVVLFGLIILAMFAVGIRVGFTGWSAFVGTLLFIVHPIHSEVVNSISFREDLLVTLFVLSGWLFYERGMSRSYGWLLVSLICYAGALFSKESGIVFLPCLFLLDALQKNVGKQYLNPKRVRFTLSALALSAIYLLVRFRLMVCDQALIVSWPANSLWKIMGSVIKIQSQYLMMLVWPVEQHVYYPESEYILPMGHHAWLGVLTFVIAGGLIVYYRRTRASVFALVWWLIAIAPMSNLIPIFNPMAERYLFLPSVGIFLWLGDEAWRWIRRGKWFPPMLVSTVLLLSATRTIMRNRDWQNDVILWTHESKSYPADLVVSINLMAAHQNAGRFAEALEKGKTILARINTENPPRRINMALFYTILAAAEMMAANSQEALTHFRMAEALLPSRADISYAIYRNIGVLLSSKGNPVTAMQYYDKAADIDPFQSDLHQHRASCLLQLGDIAGARRSWNTARGLNPQLPPFDKATD